MTTKDKISLNNRRLASLSGINPYNLRTEKDIIEFWKITELKKALELLNSQGGKGNITRNEGVDIKIKINLMEEAEEFGRKSQKQKIIEEIRELPNPMMCDWNNFIKWKQKLLNSLGEKQ